MANRWDIGYFTVAAVLPEKAASPLTPAAGLRAVWINAAGELFSTNSAGASVQVGPGAAPATHAGTHVPGAGDALATDVAVAVGTANAEGAAASFARSNHTHEVTGLKIASEAQGDVLYRNASAWVRLPAGVSGQFLQTQGAGANPQWAASGGGALSYHRVTGPNGEGSTNDNIMRWDSITANGGAEITYTDSAANGGYWQVASNGIYAVTAWGEGQGASGSAGAYIAVASALNNSYAEARCRARAQQDLNRFLFVCWTGYVAASDYIWVAQYSNGFDSGNDGGCEVVQLVKG